MEGQRVLATLWQFFWVSEGFGNPQTDFSEGMGNFCKLNIFVRELPIPYCPLPAGTDHTLEQLEEGIG
jgi:hypothetical protein